jgi:hypothetical protein
MTLRFTPELAGAAFEADASGHFSTREQVTVAAHRVRRQARRAGKAA